jgi:CubicO group peptidase (beta-lactamase class C family)
MDIKYTQAHFDQISVLIQKSMKTHRITGASVAIADGSDTIYTEGFGFADVKNHIAVTSNTVFRIGSITKVFTASAVMQLVEQGKIDLDLPVTAYIPEFTVKTRFADSRPVTVRDLLCHHSGLPSDDWSNYFSADPAMFKSVLNFLRENYMVKPPGEIFYYSNLGVNLLGIIIERAVGMPFHQHMETLLRSGLKMTDSAIILREEMQNDLSKPYAKEKEQLEGPMKYLPSGGIYSTADDMAKFMHSILSGGKGLFLRESTLNAMLIPQYPDNPLDFNMCNGLGWFIGKPGLDYAGKVIWHDGGTPNFFSLTVIIPAHQLGITILTNSATGALMNHQITIDILQQLLEVKTGIKPPAETGRTPIKLSPSIIPEKVGRFVTLAGITTIYVSGDKLIAKMPMGTFLMHPCQDGWFSLSLLLLGILPLKLKQLALLRIGVFRIKGEMILAMEQLGLRSPYGKEYRPLNISASWEERIGYYECVREKKPRLKSFRLCRSADGMFISAQEDKVGKLKLYLDVINDSEAIIYGFGRASGETIFASPEELRVFGLYFKKQK